MTGDRAAALRRYDHCPGDLAAETVAQYGKLIEGFRAGIAGLAADENGDDPFRCHHIDLIGNVVALKIAFPVHNNAGAHVLKNAGIETDFIDIQLQYAADIAQPGADLQVSEVKDNALSRLDGKVLEHSDLLKRPERLLRRGDAASVLAFDRIGAVGVKRNRRVLRRL